MGCGGLVHANNGGVVRASGYSFRHWHGKQDTKMSDKGDA
jgi:hypothetical protein